MKNNNTLLLIGGALLALAGASYALFKFVKKNPNFTTQAPEGTSYDNTSNGSSKLQPELIQGLNYDLVLKLGSKNNEVKELQRLLIQNHNVNLGTTGENKDGADGVFGAKTQAALLATKAVATTTLNKFLNYV
jgi:hypothetical protein